jgi:thioredoxin 1
VKEAAVISWPKVIHSAIKEITMNTGKALMTVLVAFLLLAGCSEASDIDNMLAQAKQDSKIVMLELGSVGCTPCEQMKPVMEKLRTAYKDKLEVIFVDVRRDNATGRRFSAHVIPTQVFLDKNGKEFHRHVGFYSYEEIAPVLKQAGL